MKNFSSPMVHGERGGRWLKLRALLPALLTLLIMVVHPPVSRAFDIQFMGDFDYMPTSPLQNSTPFGLGGMLRITWEFRPDWDFTANLGSEFFQTTETLPVNPVTYYPNSSGLVSMTPLSFGVYHILYRNQAKDYLYGVGDLGTALEYTWGAGHITPEPFAELGLGWSFKQWFIEERVAGVSQAFPPYPAPGFPSGPILMFTTSVGVHFFVF